MRQPVPNVSRADVERIVRRDFAPADVSGALTILDEYKSDGGSPWRVQLAVLKLAAGNISALRREIQTANSDYRDVLGPAEYPRYSRDVLMRDVPESVKQVAVNTDWKEYESWLRRGA